MIKLNVPVTDTATKAVGTLTHSAEYLNGNIFYHFKPSGLNATTGVPLKGIWIVGDRIKGGVTETEPSLARMARNILGEAVEHIHNGFSGIATNFEIHLNGCVHVYVQPDGADKDGEAYPASEFSILELKHAGKKGKMIVAEAKAKAERKHRPSPSHSSRPPHA